MSRPKPPPRTLAPEDERKVQVFLERAAPIVLNCRVLDAGTWESLADLAAELELSNDQLRDTVEDLRQRGVIERIELRPPKPPPLPHTSSEQGTADTAEFEQQFSLAPRPPLPKSARRAPPPPPPPVEANLAKPAGGSSQQQFVQRARQILAEHRGWGAKAQSLIAAAGEEFGVSPAEARELLRGGGSPADEPVEVVPSRDDEEAVSSRRWRVEGQPPPEPAPARKKPSEIFREFVEQSFEKCARGTITQEVEERVVKHGSKVLKLAEVYARQIVSDVVHQRQYRLLSQPQAEEADETSLSPEEREFRQRAVSILAEHRGINAKSRVLLTALAGELGFSSQQVETAVASLQDRPLSEAELAEGRHAERLAAFRRHLKVALAKLPRAILLPNANQLLVEQGNERYGVELEAAAAAVREAAEELKLSVITIEQATQHIEGLLDLILGDSLRLGEETRERVFSQAAQWGLAPETTDSIVQARVRQNYRHKRSQEKLANTALMAGACAVTMVVAFIAWLLMSMSTSKPLVADPSSGERALLDAIRPPADRDDSWWNRELSIALAQCRNRFPHLRPTLHEIGSRQASRRSDAYERLVERFFEPKNTDVDRQLFAALLSQCYSLDPDEDAARRLALALLEPVPAPEQRLVANQDLYENAFWGLRVVVGGLAQAAGSKPSRRRAEVLATMIANRIGTADIDTSQTLAELERSTLGALAEHLFYLLIESAESKPAMGLSLHEIVAPYAARYLDGTFVDQLNAKFLVAIHRGGGEDGEEFRELAKATIESTEPLAVERMIGLFETAESGSLRDFMERRLKDRTGVTAESTQPFELAEQFRRALGISSDATLAGRQRKYSRLADQTLDDLRGTAEDPQQLLRETVTLAWLETLGCALAQDERGADVYRKLVDEPAELKASGSARPGADRGFSSVDASNLRVLRGYLNRLANARWVPRATQITNLANLAETLPDLPAPDARRLADYLIELKPGDERDAVLRTAGRLGKWPQLLLAVADRLDRDRRRQPISRAKELVEALLARELGSSDRSPLVLDDLQGALLQGTLRADLPKEEPAATNLLESARQALASQYSSQIRLLGVSVPADRERLSALVEAMITAQAGRLRREDLTQKVRQELDGLPSQFEAIEYYSEDDLHRTVLLERVWLGVLEIAVTVRHPEDQAQMKAVLQELQRNDRQAGSMLVQLRDGHRALVEAWLLLNGQKRGAT